MATILTKDTSRTARRVYKGKPGRRISGIPIGILALDAYVAELPGSAGNASSFDFPVLYKYIPQLSFAAVKRGDPEFVEALVANAKELEREGVRAIVGQCGFMLPFQETIAAAVRIPVFTSSLLLVPLMLRSIAKGRRIGVITGDKSGWSPQMWKATGVDPDLLVVAGMEDREAWIHYYWDDDVPGGVSVLDPIAAQEDVVAVATELRQRNPDIGLFLFECAALPSYAKAVEDAVGLPVCDFMTLARLVHDLVVKREYSGIV